VFAEQISSDPQLAKRFMAAPPESTIQLLPANMRRQWQQFIEQYGCRSRHRTLYVKRWVEDPGQILKILQALIEQQTMRQPPAKQSFGHSAKRFTQARLDHPTPGRPECPADPDRRILTRRLAGIATPLLLNWARKYLDLREDLRFLLDRCLFQIRTSIITLGRAIGLDDDILFLKEEEIQSLIDRRLAAEDAQKTAQQRRRDYLQPSTPMPYLIDGIPLTDFTTNRHTFQGMGTSPGRVAGTARIVEDPTDRQLHKSDILIAKTTDPGWTPVLSRVGGMVIEEGGLLNHCSIVARELKVPAVVGIYGATHRILEGARITIDGGLGLVRIEEE
jgi:pyruvate,water dikinase